MHAWNLSIEDAKQLQVELAQQVIDTDRFGTVQRVAGTDVGFEDNGKTTRAAIAVLSFPDLQLLEYAIHRQPTRFPYVPGYLSFRECPALLEALSQLRAAPDLLLCDGQGVAHPRGFGIACHLGVLTGIPSIGVAKSRLVGSHAEVGNQRGDWQPLQYRDKTIGAVLRTRSGVKPVYVSTGHRVGLTSAIAFTLACAPRYRLPETTRWADGLASARPAIMKRLANQPPPR